jgi:hypothetical protein
MSTIRRSVAFTPPQYVFLEKEAERLGVSIGELIRRIVDSYRFAK